MENINLSSETTKQKNKKSKVIIIVLILALAIAAACLAWYFLSRPANKKENVPEVKVAQINKVKLSDETFELPVTLSAMPKNILFPAASFTMTFDNTKLELLGLKEGNVMILADENAQAKKLNLPEWKINTAFANQSGRINIMYLDSTAGRYAFCDSGFNAETQNVLFKLEFRLRGSANEGDVYDVIIQDACFAASDETRSLAMTKKHLMQ